MWNQDVPVLYSYFWCSSSTKYENNVGFPGFARRKSGCSKNLLELLCVWWSYLPVLWNPMDICLIYMPFILAETIFGEHEIGVMCSLCCFSEKKCFRNLGTSCSFCTVELIRYQPCARTKWLPFGEFIRCQLQSNLLWKTPYGRLTCDWRLPLCRSCCYSTWHRRISPQQRAIFWRRPFSGIYGGLSSHISLLPVCSSHKELSSGSHFPFPNTVLPGLACLSLTLICTYVLDRKQRYINHHGL